MKKSALVFIFLIFGFLISTKGALAAFPSSGLQSYWGMDSMTQNSPIYDSEPINPITSNTTLDACRPRNGVAGEKIGNSYCFNSSWCAPSAIGCGGNISFPAAPVLTKTNWTFSAWVKPFAANQSGNILHTGSQANNNGWSFNMTAGQLTSGFGGCCGINSGYFFPDTNWHFVVLTRDSSYLVNFYVDGVQTPNRNQNPGSTFPNDPWNVFYIGYSGSTSYGGAIPFNGKIDEVGVWNRALSQGEIDTLWNGGSGLSYTAPTVNGVTISNPVVIPDGSHQYTISVTASDPNGYGDINSVHAMINMDGSNNLTHLPDNARGFLSWTAATCVKNNSYGPSYINLINCTTTFSGNTRTVNFIVTFNPSYTSPLADNDISGYAVDSVGKIDDTGYYGWINSNLNFQVNPPPTGNTVTINTSPVIPDSAHQYTISVTGTDPNGYDDIKQEYALINYQGGLPNEGQHRGYLGWTTDDSSPFKVGERVACTNNGSPFGYAVVVPGYGDTYIHIKSCNITNNGSLSRTANFLVTFDFNYTSPLTNNDISGLVYDSQGSYIGWSNSDLNFAVNPVPNIDSVTIKSGGIPTACANTQAGTSYTISVTGSDLNGLGDIYQLQGLINLQGGSVGQHRGYLLWGLGNWFSSYQDPKTCTGGTGADGYAAIVPASYGNSYIHLDSCSVTNSLPNSRTANFVVHFDPTFTNPNSPPYGNDISGLVFDSLNSNSGWLNFPTNFNVTTSCAAQAALGKNCGSMSDGCSGTLNCPSCTSGNCCVNNTCTATPNITFTANVINPQPAGLTGQICVGGTCKSLIDGQTFSVQANNFVSFSATHPSPGDYSISPLSGNFPASATCTNIAQTFTYSCVGNPNRFISGSFVSIPSGNTTFAYASGYSSNPVTSGTYSISVPTSVTGIPYLVSAKPITNYSYTPGYTNVPVYCSDVNSPNTPSFTYVQNFCPVKLQPDTTYKDTDLKAVYHMDETTLNPVVDSSGNNNNGTVTGTTIVPSQSGYGKARNFSINTDRITTTLNGLSSSSDITISFWANVTGPATNTYFLTAIPDDAANRLNIHFPWSDGRIYWDFGNVFTTGRLSTAFDPSWYGTWFHWTFVSKTGVGQKIYRNGIEIASDNDVSTFTPGSKTLSIGSADGVSLPWKGSLDELRIWNTALTPAQIGAVAQQLCLTGVPVNCDSLSLCQNPDRTTVTCGSGFKYRNCHDSGNLDPSIVIEDTPLYCIAQPPHTISGAIMNAPQDVTVNGTLFSTPTGGTCSLINNPVADPKTSYSLTAPAYCGYNLDLQAIGGYTSTPGQYPVTFGCSSNSPGPTFWYNSGAGIAIQGAIPQANYYGTAAGSGVSQNGIAPGFRLENYTSPLPQITYQGFFADAAKNYGLPTSPDPCVAPQLGTKQGTTNSFYCYDAGASTNLNTVLTSALTGGTGTIVIYAKPGTNGDQILTTAKSLVSKNILVFVNGSLEVKNNIAIDLNSTGLFILTGDLQVDSNVTGLDGVYVFPGNFTDVYTGSSATALIGRGSIIQTTTGKSFILDRRVDKAVGPAEQWYFEPKYLKTYQNIFFTPKFTWQEITPQ